MSTEPIDTQEYQQIVEYLQIAQQSKYSDADIKARFEAEPASTYGEGMDRWIPDFTHAHKLLLESVAVHLPADAHGVDLGAGSGRVSKLLLDSLFSILVEATVNTKPLITPEKIYK